MRHYETEVTAYLNVLQARMMQADKLDYRDWQTINKQVIDLQKITRDAVRSFVVAAIDKL